MKRIRPKLRATRLAPQAPPRSQKKSLKSESASWCSTRFRALPSGPRRATTSVTPRAPRVGGMGQRVYKPLLGVADTNHLLSIHIWVMLGNVQPLIQVRKWLRGLPDVVPHGHARHRMTPMAASEGQHFQNFKLAPELMWTTLSCNRALW